MSWLEKRAESFVKDADPGTGTPYVSMWDAMELAREFAERAIRGMYDHKKQHIQIECDQ